MKIRFLQTVLFALALVPFVRSDAAAAEEPSSARYVCPEWFRDAKFGIWSHWGPSSIPGLGNEFPKDMYKQGTPSYQWFLKHFGHPSERGYKDLIESWKAERFDPEALMDKYKAAGAKYFFTVATHHDNFDCFDSTHHEWNSVKHGPGKDIVGMWRAAALKAGLRFGISSHADDRGWNYYYNATLSDTSGPLAGKPYDGADPANRSLYNMPKQPKESPPDSWCQEWLLRHTELVDKYKPDLLYFDGGLPHGDYGRKLAEHYLGAGRDVVINIKSGGFVRDYERGGATVIMDGPWQDDTSLGGWFFLNDPIADFHSKSKDAATVIHTLADVVSKNGNLLLNLPQRGDGSLYPECVTVLEELAAWMPVNGEAIFGTRPWSTFGEGPTPLPEAKCMNELKHPLSWNDVRFTRKGDFLYVISCGVPDGPLKIRALGRLGVGFDSIELLGSSEKIRYKREWEGLTIQPVKEWPCRHAVVFKVRLKS